MKFPSEQANTLGRVATNSRVGPPDGMTSERLRGWAAEHLMYEVETLAFVVLELGKRPGGMVTNALLESFVVHFRCLNDFLWRDRGKHNPRDAFAADFCSRGAWKDVREGLPQEALSQVRPRRFGREVMHLTYDRIDGIGEKKEWPCGKVLLEILTALEKFANLALADRLDAPTRSFLTGLKMGLPRGRAVRPISGATALSPALSAHVVDPTIDVADIRAGGEV